ncbi:MAG: Fic family protein [Bacilli bacterium]|jgi:Fic family protein|nr:Fic family protein [Bacilli bacterium]MCH4235855.1 Fic family protein [Bacilli bacterium]
MPYKPPFELTEEMIDLVSKIMENLGYLNSINELEKFPRLRRVSRLKSVQSSLAIENNTLSLEEISDVIDGRKVLGKQEDIQAAKNAFAAYKMISSIDAYDISSLLKVHRIMMSGLIADAGSFRSKGVGIFDFANNLVHMAPPAKIVFDNMRNLFVWLKTSDTNILIKSCVFHYEFEFIHPFSDGNGRMGRLWQTVILSKWKPIFEWIPIESIIKDNQEAYYKAIECSTKKSTSTPFIEFMLLCINDAIKDIVMNSRSHYKHISRQVNALMEVIDVYPQSTNELMEKLHLKSKDSFRNHYIKPALEAGLIAMTSPDKPRSRNQGYYKI